MSDTQKAIERAALARVKHAIAEARNLIVVLDKIKNGNVPITEFAQARGCAAKVMGSVSEASAYATAAQTIEKGSVNIPLSRPAKKRDAKRSEPKTFRRTKADRLAATKETP